MNHLRNKPRIVKHKHKMSSIALIEYTEGSWHGLNLKCPWEVCILSVIPWLVELSQEAMEILGGGVWLLEVPHSRQARESPAHFWPCPAGCEQASSTGFQGPGSSLSCCLSFLTMMDLAMMNLWTKKPSPFWLAVRESPGSSWPPLQASSGEDSGAVELPEASRIQVPCGFQIPLLAFRFNSARA